MHWLSIRAQEAACCTISACSHLSVSSHRAPLGCPSKCAQEAARRSISAAGLPAAIERQAAAAVEEADALILVVDGQVSVIVCLGQVWVWD